MSEEKLQYTYTGPVILDGEGRVMAHGEGKVESKIPGEERTLTGFFDDGVIKKGQITYPDGDRYEGSIGFRPTGVILPNGFGKMTLTDGTTIEGGFEFGELSGSVKTTKNGQVEETYIYTPDQLKLLKLNGIHNVLWTTVGSPREDLELTNQIRKIYENLMQYPSAYTAHIAPEMSEKINELIAKLLTRSPELRMPDLFPA